MTLRLLSKFNFFLLIASIITWMPSPVFSIEKKKGFETSAEIAAIVNEYMISVEDLRNRAKFFSATSGQPFSEAFFERNAAHILTALINESLQRQQAKFFKINIGKEEVKNAVIQMEKVNGKERGFLEKLCKQFDIPFDVLEKQVKASLAWDIISREMFRVSLQVSKSEIDSYIKRLEANKNRPHVHLAEIFISVDNAAQAHEAREKINGILRYLNQGAHFSVLAQQFSESPTKTQGGNIGWIPQNELDSDLKTSVVRLSVNDYTSPIRTKDGYKIVYLVDRKATSPETAAQTIYTYKRVNFPISRMTSQQKLMEVFHKATSISQNARSCDMLETLAKNAGGAQIKEVGGVSARDLPPPVLGILNKLVACKVGDNSKKCKASAPIRSDIGILMFMVCKQENIAAGKIDRKNIENKIANRKLQKLMGREMRNLRRAAHVVNKLNDTVSMKIANQ